MYKLPLAIGLVAALAACNKHDAKALQADQSYTASAPVLDKTGRQIGEARSLVPAAARVHSTSAPSTIQVATLAQPNGSAQPIPPLQSAVRQVPPPEPARPIAIPAGTHIRVRLEQTIDTKHNRPGDRFEASLVSPVQVNGNFVVPRGTMFMGHVAEAKHSGRFKGHAVLGVQLDSFRLNGTVYLVLTAPDTVASGRHRKRNLVLMGGGAATGATIGAVAGGGPGALIGAGAGAGAGAVGAFFTGRKDVKLPVETPLTFRLRANVEFAGG